MASYEHAIDVHVPVRTAYNQWTQFEKFPQFMESVEEIRQLSDTRLHWRARIAGVEQEWEAEIDEQIPISASPGTASPARAIPGS